MHASLVDADTLMAVDIGTVNTRVALFDVVEGHYRFIASGQAPTTAAAPIRDPGEGVRQAIENLQTITGRKFLGEGRNPIIPISEGKGVDTFTATLSAGPAIKTAVVGLLDEVSLESILRLARSSYTQVIETIGLNDPRKPEQQIDNLVRLHPDLMLIAGGTDGGATRSVLRLMETVGLACYLMPAEGRPVLLFAGNQKLAAEIKKSLQPLVSFLSISPNLRPGIDTEDLQPAQHALTQLSIQLRSNQMKGLDQINGWAGNTLMPTASAEGRIIRFLSRVYDSRKGILGVDLGASAAVIAAAFGGELTLGVFPQFGLGEGLPGLLGYTRLEEILKWIPFEISVEAVEEHLFQKSINPGSIPATPEDLSIEQAVARQCLFAALNLVSKDYPRRASRIALDLTPYFEPILAAGSVVTHAPTLGQSLLILLDGIQPVGITTVILDQNNLLPALGAAASRNSILPIQVLESGAFLGIATVVAPFSSGRFGTPLLNARLIYKNGTESQKEVKLGGLEVLPLPAGQSARLYLQPLNQTDIGLGAGRTREDGFPVTGTALGVVIDGRGRPLRLPSDSAQRCELIKKWQWTLGG